MMRARWSIWRYRSLRMMSAPLVQAACGQPQALAWNIGTIGRTRSASEKPKALPVEICRLCR